MKIADIKVGYNCNNDCLHCVITSQRSKAEYIRGETERSFNDCINEIDRSIKNGCKLIVVTGGEPTIRDDFFEILDFIKQKGARIILQTNGRKLGDVEFARRLKDYPIFYVVAIHSFKEEVHDIISQRPNSYCETVNGLKNILDFTQNIMGKSVISKYNYRDLSKIVQFFLDMNIRNLLFSFPHAQGNAWIYRDKVVPTYEDIIDDVNKAIDVIENYNKVSQQKAQIRFETIPFCYLQGREHYVQEWYHTKKQTIELKQLDSLTTIDWVKKRGEIKVKPFEKCNKCEFDDRCEGVWDDYAAIYLMK